MTDEYLSWVNNKEVKKYLEINSNSFSMLELKKYVEKTLLSSSSVFLAIEDAISGKHIGNIKLGPIDYKHNNAPIGIMIGDKNYWGRGIASEAIMLLSDYAFRELHLHKIYAGFYSLNIASMKTFLKSGFSQEARLVEHCLYEGRYIDKVYLSKLNPNG